MDPERFLEARVQALHRQQGGIGTLGEKTLHATLKHYFEPAPENHEVRLGPYVADIVGERGVIEIQTRSFQKLRRKLEAFLKAAPVTVVYPVPALKWLVWVDQETGEATPRRKSSKRYGPWEILPELYKLRDLLENPGLRLCIVLLEVEDTRLLNGWSRDRKRGSSRFDRIPLALLGEIEVDCPADYAVFLPEGLQEPFTSRDYQKATRLSLSRAQAALNVLTKIKAVRREGRGAKGYLYRKAFP